MNGHQKIKDYVLKNYPKRFKNKEIIINEGDACYFITSGKDQSPLILGKKIWQQEI